MLIEKLTSKKDHEFPKMIPQHNQLMTHPQPLLAAIGLNPLKTAVLTSGKLLFEESLCIIKILAKAPLTILIIVSPCFGGAWSLPTSAPTRRIQ